MVYEYKHLCIILAKEDPKMVKEQLKITTRDSGLNSRAKLGCLLNQDFKHSLCTCDRNVGLW